MVATATAWEGRDARYWREWLGLPVVHLYAAIPSTNDIGRELAEQGAPHLTLVVADHQTHGRGRGGKEWVSAPGSSLLCSIIFRYHATRQSAPGAAPVRIGHAVAGAIQRLAGAETRVKWPNDVVIPEHGKVAGILCEGAVRQNGSYIVAGIGINLRSPGADYVSLSEASAKDIPRSEMLAELVARVKLLADAISTPLSDPELAAMRPRDILFGQRVQADNEVVGRAVGIARDGSLLVQTADGLRTLHNATIRLAGSQAYPGVEL